MSRTNPNFQLKCPSPYKLDPSLGLCVEPTPPGFNYVNGRFYRQCPPGMIANDQGICIRPVIARTSFIPDSSYQKTTIALGATSGSSQTSQVVFGSYDAASMDVSFTKSLGIPDSRVTQVSLVDTSTSSPTSAFLVASDQRGIDTTTVDTLEIPDQVNLYGMSIVNASGPVGPVIAQANISESDAIPESSVSKFQYSDAGPQGQMYFLGAPRNTIFLSEFSAGLYNNWPNNSDSGPIFTFEDPAYSLEGETFPYYVGSYENVKFNANFSLEPSPIGAVQTNVDADLLIGTLAEPTGPILPNPNPSPGHSDIAYVKDRPLDPVPQILESISDISSRGFHTAELLSSSKGFILGGRQYAPQFLDKAFGGALAVRYLTNDPGPSAPTPYRPTIQSLYSLNLNFPENNGDIRVARFNTSDSVTGSPDTIYVFGNTVSDSSLNNGNCLSFVTEDRVYGNLKNLGFAFGISTTASVTTDSLQNQIFALTTSKISQGYAEFTNLLNSIVSSTIAGVTVSYDPIITMAGAPQYRATFTVDPSLPVTLFASILFSNTNATLGQYLGFTLGIPQTLTPGPAPNQYYLTANVVGSQQAIDTYILYNGLSWDDTSKTYNAGDFAQFLRPSVNCIPVVGDNGDFNGLGLTAWSFDPVSSCLGFAIQSASETSALSTNIYNTKNTKENTTFLRQTYIFDHNGFMQRFLVPEDTVDLEVQLWGAGGSSDPNATGTGGAGAYVAGHLKPTEWSPGSFLDVIVGSGYFDPAWDPATFGTPQGSGGTGNKQSIGRGGGRSAISVNGRDIVTAGGGGGSTGTGQGGAATATIEQAEQGLPAVNGGLGATPLKAGRGGTFFGEPKFFRAPDGSFLSGAPSTWTVSQKSYGSGGGGGGFFGGGSAGYLGYTGHVNDLQSGAGGGSSYTDKLVHFRGISGTRSQAPFTSSPFYTDSIAVGGSPSNNGHGGHGRVVIIATVRSSLGGAPKGLPTFGTSLDEPYKIFASSPDAFNIMTPEEFGIVTDTQAGAHANWSSKFTRLNINISKPGGQGTVSTMFVGLPNEAGQALAVVITQSEDGSVYVPASDGSDAYTHVWWGFLDGVSNTLQLTNEGTTNAFGPILYESPDTKNTITLEPIRNVKTIRALDSLNGSRALVFVGDGVRIIQAPSIPFTAESPAGQFTEPKFVLNTTTGLPMDLTTKLYDSQYTQGSNELSLVGRPDNMLMSTLLKTPWAPTFASFYDTSDVASEFVPYINWFGVSGAGPLSTPVAPNGPPLPLQQYQTTASQRIPNTILLIRRKTPSVTPWTALSIYANQFALSSTFTNPDGLTSACTQALNLYLVDTLGYAPSTVSASAVLNGSAQLSITIVGLAVDTTFEIVFVGRNIPDLPYNSVDWDTLFNSSGSNSLSEANVDVALKAAGKLLGFNGIVSSVTTSGGSPLVYQANFQGTSSIQFAYLQKNRDILPNNVPDCALWLSSSSATNFQLGPNNEVLTWYDLSGNERNAIAIPSVNSPTWSNTQSTVVFDATNAQALSTTLPGSFGYAQSVTETGFIVCTVASAGTLLGATLDISRAINLSNNSLSIIITFGNPVSSFDTSLQNLALITYSYTTTNGLITESTCYKNNQQVNAVSETPQTLGEASTTTVLGASYYVNSSNISSFFGGNLSELIVYQGSALSQDDFEGVTQFLLKKYNIQNADPYTFNGLDSVDAALTPLSVALPSNNTIAGSIYHTYSPVPFLAAAPVSSVFPTGRIVTVGGPLCSPVDTFFNQTSNPLQKLGQPVPYQGASQYIDFVTRDGISYSWQIMNLDNTIATSSQLVDPIRSPANVMVSIDGASTYQNTYSYLGAYLQGLGIFPTNPALTNYAFTGLDCFHFVNIDGVPQSVGPAQLRNVTDQSGVLNAMVSQFNDVQWFPNINYNANGTSIETTTPGFFLAVGQFLWEYNAMLAPTSVITWPPDWSTLDGVVWVSLDGITWTTIPLRQKGSSDVVDNFWLVYRIDFVDPDRNIAILVTDIGLYQVDISELQQTVLNVFAPGTPGESNLGPVIDFSRNGRIFINVTPTARTGEFRAYCTSRETTGACISCEGSGKPVNINRLISGGGPRDDVVVCLAQPQAAGAISKVPYSATEAAVDALAISAYAGYDGDVKSTYVRALQQSFLSNADNNLNTIIICPQYVNVGTTPSNVLGRGEAVEYKLQCDLNPAFVSQSTPFASKNATGGIVVRRPALPAEPGTRMRIPDVAYNGGITNVSFKTPWQPDYMNEYRHLTLTPFDTFGAETESGPYTSFYTSMCPSTVGLGGSTRAPPPVGASNVYPNIEYESTSGISLALWNRITNLMANSGYTNGTLLEGPRQENESLGDQGSNWNPSGRTQNRAVLANINDTLPIFAYAKAFGNTIGRYPFLDYNPFDQQGTPDAPFQSKNPYLYQLSSFPFPYDGQATNIDETTSEAVVQITPGRDPQVYEPGFGPLLYYINFGGTTQSTGFAFSPFNTNALSWPVNPLPQEGFGIWYIREEGASPTSGSPYAGYPTGLYESQLGYGTLPLAPVVPTYRSAYASYAKFTNTFNSETMAGFLYNPEVSKTQTYQTYLDWPTLGTNGIPTWSSGTPNWTIFMQYNAPKVLPTNSIVNNGLQQYIPVAPLTLDDFGATRRLHSKWSLQNFLALRLKGQSKARQNDVVSNWRFLVSVNFFRPRNWAFRGLLLNANGQPVSTMTNNNVPQLVLASDQPNAAGQYEFLVPDPYFAKDPVGPSIVGFPTTSFAPTSTDYKTLTKVVLGYQGALPQSLTVLQSTVPILTNILAQHVAFHYWTFTGTSTNATVDMYVNMTKIFQLLSSNGNLDLPIFDWAQTVTLPNATWNPTLLQSVLQTYLQNVTGGLSQATNAVSAILAFALNPLRNFFWSDPTAQTERSLQSYIQQGLPVKGNVISQPVYTVPLTENGVKKRVKGLTVEEADYVQTSTTSLLHWQYSVVLPQTSGSADTVRLLTQENPNSVNLYSSDSSLVSPVNAYGFIPVVDPRNNSSTSYNATSNINARTRNINIDDSDYNVETNNTLLFASNQAILLRQDLLAQGPNNGNTTNASLLSFGDPIYGFGLRIDSEALIPAYRTSTASTKQDIPTDHGYISMVRTIIDGQDRYTRPNGGPSPVDPWPHAHRLTYVTKYVPSKLQAYGAIIEAPPMVIPPTWTAQNVLNPFRPRKTYLVKHVPFVTWARSITAAPSPAVYPYGSLANVQWRAFRCDALDLSAPGFLGRAPLLLFPNQATESYDATGNGLTSIFFNSSVQALAGYEGLVNHSKLLIENTNIQNATTLSYLNGLPFTVAKQGALANGGTLDYSNYLTDTNHRDVIAGQILFDLNDCLLPEFASSQVRYEMVIKVSNIPNANFKIGLTLAQFMQTYVLGAYNTLFGVVAPAFPTPALVTPAECATLFSLALTNWINANLAIPRGNPAINYSTYSNITVTSTFDLLQDRPTFTIGFTNPANVYGFETFRLVFPEPVSNWLGMRSIVPPMFDIGVIPAGVNGVTRQTCYDSTAPIGSGSQTPSDCYAINLDTLCRFSYLFYSREAKAFSKFPAIELFPRYLIDPADFPTWSSSTWISPVDFTTSSYTLYAQMWNEQSFTFSFDFGSMVSAEPFTCTGTTFSINYYANLITGVVDNGPIFGLDWGAPLQMNNWIGFSTKTNIKEPDFSIGGNEFEYGNNYIDGIKVQDNARALGNPRTKTPITYTMNLRQNGYNNYEFATTHWDTKLNGWSAFPDGTVSNQGWTSTGWINTVANDSKKSAPLYSLWYEDASSWASKTKTIVFSGRSGIQTNDVYAPQNNVSKICDITNVSWTSRLVSRDAPYYYGLAQTAGSTQVSGPLPQTGFFTAYQADATLTSTNDTDTNVIVTAITQDAPSKSLFMTGIVPSSNDVNIILTDNPFLNTSSQPKLDVTPFCAGIAVPALEVPCPFGSAGTLVSGEYAPLTKPVNYTSEWKSLLSDSKETCAPNAEELALIGGSENPIFYNWAFATRLTYNAFTPVSGSPAKGSLNSPYQFSEYLGASQATTKQLVGANSSVKTNAWPSNYVPPNPVVAPIPNGSGVNGSSGFITNACGTTVYLVNQEAYLTIGPTNGGIAKKNTQGYTQYAVYAFNYSDLFVGSSQPWISTVAPDHTVQANAVDTSYLHNTYLQGTPYFMDEPYDDKPYSTLGRSLYVGRPNKSSATGAPLVPTQQEPVVIIIAPAARNTQVSPDKGVSDLLNTYSNSLVYNFTERYFNASTLTGALYTVAFSSPQDGPYQSFYGLTNEKSVTGTDLVIASNEARTSQGTLVTRKAFFDLSSSTSIDGPVASNVLGLDIRQVYPEESLCIGPEPKSDKITTYSDFPYQVLGTFHVNSLASPNWGDAITYDTFWLPLAGTWLGDLEASQALYAPYASTQYVPNYEGLSLLALWRKSNDVVPVGSTAAGPPSWLITPVDRNPLGPIKPSISTIMPFTINNYGAYRPTTVFTLLCDIWRNSLRQPKVSDFDNANPEDGLVPDAIKTAIEYVDCMGSNDYTSLVVSNSQYFGVCAVSPNSMVPQVGTTDLSFNDSPWVTNGSIWNPFLGGGSWNGYGDNPNAAPSLQTNFAPTLWWPSYRWLLYPQDLNNTNATSVASNETLRNANQALFTCSDGTIRKFYTGGSLQGRVFQSTGVTTFYNSGVNNIPSVKSYTTPGRLYNLTWWSNNWWCTGDNSSVWTTAPLDTSPPIPINDSQIIVDRFESSVINFRPLSLSEGQPIPWLNAAWPQDEVHPFNLMKVVTYGSSTALFVGSVNGEYILIQREGNRYQSTLTTNGLPNLFTPGGCPPLEALPGPTGPTTEQSTLLYISDILTLDTSIVLGSAVIPLDPQEEASVPWYTPGTGPVPLPIMSLSFSEPSRMAVASLFNNFHETWADLLCDSNIVRGETFLDFKDSPDAPTPLDLEAYMKRFTLQLSEATIGSQGTLGLMTIDSNGTITNYTPNVLATGLSQLLKQVAATALTGTSTGPSYPFFYEPNNISNPLIKIDLDNIFTGYALQNAPDSTFSALGSVVLGLDVRKTMFGIPLFTTRSNANVQVPTFFYGGFAMDAVTRAFFVINNPASMPQLGLRPFTNASSETITPFGPGNLEKNSNWEDVLMRTLDGKSAQWQNTQAFTVKIDPTSSGRPFYDGETVRPQNGTLTLVQNKLTETDYNDLNLFVPMYIKRMSPIITNAIISDMAYAQQAEAFCFTAYGPYSQEFIRIGMPNPSSGQLTVAPTQSDFANVEPLMTGPSVVAWNPYELKWYVAGNGTHIPDWPKDSKFAGSPYNYPAVWQEYIKPANIPERQWEVSEWNGRSYAPKSATINRLLLLSGDASRGAVIDDGVSKYATKFTQVYQVENRQSTTLSVNLVSNQFHQIKCFGFSPGLTAVCGSYRTTSNLTTTERALIYWRRGVAPASNDFASDANWSRLELNTDGYVSAIKFVGYAWYIATWNPKTNISSLYFASVNFNVVTYLDAWNTGANPNFQVTTMDSTLLPQGICEEGFEPDPNNPTVCIKVCPSGYTPFGSLCVQECPGPFRETGVPNECVPDSRAARLVSPTAEGSAPVTLKPQFRPETGIPGEGIQWGTTIVYVLLLLLAFFFIFGVTRAMFRKR